MKIIFTLFFFLNSCQFFPFFQKIDNSYSLKEKLQSQNVYDSFNSVYSIKALWLNQKAVQNSLKSRLSSVASSATTNTSQLLLNTSSVIFFISLYAANFNHKNLRNHKVWNIFLKNRNKKYEAKIIASPFIQEQTHFLFPFHNSFSKGFFIKFDLQPEELSSSSKLVFYSFLGNSTFTEFKK